MSNAPSIPQAAGVINLSGRWLIAFSVIFTILPIGAGPAAAAEGSPLRQLVWGAIFSAAALWLLLCADRARELARTLEPWFVAFLIYVGLTIVWSPAPYVSFKRYVQVVGVVVMAMSAASRGVFAGKSLRLLRAPVTLMLLLSLLVVAMFPGYGITEIGWRGLSATKNTFGQVALLAAVTWYFSATEDRAGATTRLVLLLTALVALGLSRSLTAILAFAAVLGLLAIPLLRRWLTGSWRPALLVCAIIGLGTVQAIVIAAGNISWERAADWVFHLFGRDSTLSGRAYLWQLMMTELAKHPWTGLGYGGFWVGIEGAAGQIAYLVRWGYPGQAHNGYLDLLNEIGVIGVAILLVAIVAHVRRIALLSQVDARAARFHAAVLVAILTLNLTEASILRTTHLWWIAFTLSVIEVGALVGRRGALAIDPGRHSPAITG